MTVTDKNLRVLRTVQRLTTWWGFSPTIDEVRIALGLASKSTVHDHVRRLHEAGLVDYQPGSVRTLRVTEAGRERLAA